MRKPFQSIPRTFTNSFSACHSLFLFSQTVTEITDTTFLSHHVMCFFPNLRFLKHLHVYGLTLPEAKWNLWTLGKLGDATAHRLLHPRQQRSKRCETHWIRGHHFTFSRQFEHDALAGLISRYLRTQAASTPRLKTQLTLEYTYKLTHISVSY